MTSPRPQRDSDQSVETRAQDRVAWTVLARLPEVAWNLVESDAAAPPEEAAAEGNRRIAFVDPPHRRDAHAAISAELSDSSSADQILGRSFDRPARIATRSPKSGVVRRFDQAELRDEAPVHVLPFARPETQGRSLDSPWSESFHKYSPIIVTAALATTAWLLYWVAFGQAASAARSVEPAPSAPAAVVEATAVAEEPESAATTAEAGASAEDSPESQPPQEVAAAESEVEPTADGPSLAPAGDSSYPATSYPAFDFTAAAKVDPAAQTTSR